jgi:hypothetical protein
LSADPPSRTYAWRSRQAMMPDLRRVGRRRGGGVGDVLRSGVIAVLTLPPTAMTIGRLVLMSSGWGWPPRSPAGWPCPSAWRPAVDLRSWSRRWTARRRDRPAGSGCCSGAISAALVAAEVAVLVTFWVRYCFFSLNVISHRLSGPSREAPRTRSPDARRAPRARRRRGGLRAGDG